MSKVDISILQKTPAWQIGEAEESLKALLLP